MCQHHLLNSTHMVIVETLAEWCQACPSPPVGIVPSLLVSIEMCVVHCHVYQEGNGAISVGVCMLREIPLSGLGHLTGHFSLIY